MRIKMPVTYRVKELILKKKPKQSSHYAQLQFYLVSSW